MKNFKTFEQMMENQKGAKATEIPVPWNNDLDFEIVGDYIAIYAHSGSVKKAQDFAKENDLHVLTETIEDGDEVTYSYVRGFAYVNRERFFFTEKNDDFCFEEII